jgi:hypothetical protein
VVFLAEFTEKHLGQRGGCRRKQPDVKQFVRPWISSVDESGALVRQPERFALW